MSTILHTPNVNYAFSDAFWNLRVSGIREESRNGPVLVMPGLFVTEYEEPVHRVLFNKKRDANHVFHLMETIWMFAGRSDVKWLEQFNSRYGSYADPDGRVWGAYGARWRTAFWVGDTNTRDQILEIIRVLKSDPGSRQAVLQMWDAHLDLGTKHADRPCNTHVYFDCRGGVLNMTVCCRSNDVLWGAYGANVVHFSFLQELIAAGIGIPVGTYRQMSNNFHVYTDLPQVQEFLEVPPLVEDLYVQDGNERVLPLLAPWETVRQFLDDCYAFCNGYQTTTAFLTNVAVPLRDAYLARKSKQPYDLTRVPDCDWKKGFQIWLANRGEE